MRQRIYMLFLFICFSATVVAQGSATRGRGGFSLSSQYGKQQADSLSIADTAHLSNEKRINAFRITNLGERYIAPMDTDRLNTANSTLMEYRSTAIAYTGNIGSPSQSRIFTERKEERDFIFADAYDPFITTPQNAYFYDTKVPYSNVLYTRSGAGNKREEQLKVLLTSNFGKKVNVGSDFDYIYSKGHYNSNGNKMINYRFFGNYCSDRYEAHAYFRNFNFVNLENGGLTDDRFITNPEIFEGRKKRDSKDFDTRFSNVWNRVRGKNLYLTHRYNLGFYRDLTEDELERKNKKKAQREEAIQRNRDLDSEESNPEGVNTQPEVIKEDPHENEIFVPVSSILHTFEYEDYRRRFIAKDTIIDSLYTNHYGKDSILNDQFSSWKMNNTIGLSLREGFQTWAKFGLIAFVRFENRHFSMRHDSVFTGEANFSENSAYIGGELAKQKGKLLTYQAFGELCFAGTDIGEFRLNGDVQSNFTLFKKNATIQAKGYIKNLTPAFYQRNFHSRYFWWDNPKMKQVQRVHVESLVSLEKTRTSLSVGVESIQNYVYFNKDGVPGQYGSNLQVITGRLKQDFRFKALGWENELVYQLSSNKDILPLPQLSAYSNLYVSFKVAKVLTLQLGADVHYHTAYYSPTYEAATQQFQLQDQIKIGNYPLVNAYANLHLKQARFFVTGYNLSSLVVNQPNYFSMPHFPLNPMVLKLGISVFFNN